MTIGPYEQHRSLEEHVGAELKRVLLKPGRLPFSTEFKGDSPSLWQDASAAAVKAVDEWRALQEQKRLREPFRCPINHDGCVSCCGSYGCGG